MKKLFRMTTVLMLILTAFLLTNEAAQAFTKRSSAPKVEEKPPVKIEQPVEAPVHVEEPAKPTVYKAEWPKQEWTDFAAQALESYGKNMLVMNAPKDASEWCPKFSSLTYEQRKQMFITLIASMAKRESNWKPETNYTESFKDSSGTKVVSRGLTQISKESANSSSYKCGISNATELNDPKTNIDCTVKILNKWVVQDKYFGTDKLGGGRYWSVMRPGDSKKFIQGKVKAVCASF